MAAADADDPVVMLNLLRYRAQAEDGHGVDGMTGEAAYREYGKRFAELNPRFGGEPIWMGRADDVIIGDEEWDIVILVRYPTRRHFVTMLADPDYQAIAPIRAAALADSRLIETTQLLPPPDQGGR
ncbi:MAG: DUF1330 domain-containing protein [Actinomycetia bacterium]|nr:DUF1330 domain-containing protein [bacterium]MCP4958047.1 DUF1330 domain-containing protein [Actinomycetes bacterium]